MTVTTIRAWRSRVRGTTTGLNGRGCPWLAPQVSLYWRRRRMAFRAAAPKRPPAATPRSSPATTNVTIHHHRHEATRLVERAGFPPSVTFVTRLTRTVNTLVTLLRDRVTVREVAARLAGAAMLPERRPLPLAPAARPSADPARRPVAKSLRPFRIEDDASFSVPAAFRRRGVLQRSAGDGVPAEMTMRPRLRPVRTIAAHPEPRLAAAARAAGAARIARGATGRPPDAAAATATGRAATAAVPMEWRTAAAKQADAPRARAAARPSIVEAAAPMPQPAVSPAPATAPAASRPRETAGALPLDASVIDRLAETVMQRIDRRIRIERERRGV